ncbi:hypothetical protein [Mesoflavibacter zeaxanthinifaciens]|uniref:hypothetical protein n=1 Tax=Mesoflavibacter zeaxanthinifaciens TaxID=393060 RepID=UPI00041DE91B|nr:hypothetical protein [Mesoflavibacter zeaxanthinifaciens]
MIKIIQPNENDNGYKYEFVINGEKGTGYLTYDLLDNLKKRTLLLTTKSNIIKSKKVKRSFDTLRNQIELYKSKGSFYTAKGIVNSIYDKEFNIPHISIAVHRFGSIPVCVLPEKFKVVFNGHERECRIGVYPYIENKAKSSNEHQALTSKLEFLRSLKIRLDVVFNRYLEDVAENFFDIENHSDLPAAIKKAKSCESILSESITSKTDAINSTTRGLSNQFFYELTKTKRELNDLYGDSIFKVRYAKYFAYFFINELYKIIGFSSKDFKEKFRKLKNDKIDYDSRIKNDNDLILLRQSILNYHSEKVDKTLEDDLANQTSSLWVKRFINFSTFLYNLREQSLISPLNTKIFLSNRFTKSDSQTLRYKIEHLIEQHFANRVELITVKETTPGKFINEVVKSKIWLSTATYSVIPNTEDSDEANFDWLTKEAIHSVTLQNKLLFILSKSHNKNLIKNFKNYIDKSSNFLNPECRNIELAKSNLIRKLNNKLHAIHDINETDDEGFNKSLIESIKSLIELRVINIIDAWLNQFSDDISSAILDINILLNYPTGISKASRKVFKWTSAIDDENENTLNDYKKKFRYVWSQIRKRKLIIDNEEYMLIKQIGSGNKTKYQQNLDTVLTALIGNDGDINSLIERCYNLRNF